MANKATIISNINSFITAIITVAKHRLSMLEVVNEIYQEPLIDTPLTTNVVTKIPDGFSYYVVFKKTGNTVVFTGRFFNLTGSAVSNVNLMTITNTEFRPNSLSSTDLAFFCTNNLYLTLNPSNYIIKINGTLASGEYGTFNGTYTTTT